MNLILIPILAASTLSATSIAGGPPKLTPELLAKGKAAYQAKCVNCHGEKGDGLGPAGKYMEPRPRDFAKDKFTQGNSVSAIFKTVTQGINGTAMAGFPTLPEEDRWGLAYFVRSFMEKKKK